MFYANENLMSAVQVHSHTRGQRCLEAKKLVKGVSNHALRLLIFTKNRDTALKKPREEHPHGTSPNIRKDEEHCEEPCP